MSCIHGGTFWRLAVALFERFSVRKMRLGTALALLSAVMCPLLLESTTTCQLADQSDNVERNCPVSVNSTEHDLTERSTGFFRVKVRVWIKADDFSNCPKIEIQESPGKEISLRPTQGRKKTRSKMCDSRGGQERRRVICKSSRQRVENQASGLWELVHEMQVKLRRSVSVSYIKNSASCKVSYSVPEPIPEFELSVNLSSKSITINMTTAGKVYARWCYESHDGSNSTSITIDSKVSPLALLPLPYLLPCICVEVYYTYPDARRRRKCPFKNKGIIDVQGVWETTVVRFYKSKVEWSAACPDKYLNVSASLCWKQNKHLCVPLINSTLEKSSRPPLAFNTSAVDRHPQICIQFSVKGGHKVDCPFKDDEPSWEVNIGPGRQSVIVFITSSAQANYSTQLCVLSERGCKPLGTLHSVRMEGRTVETRLNVPLHFLTEKPCVQVWQSDPALLGRRILCLNYVHNRRGLYAVAALIFVVGGMLLGLFIRNVAKSGAAGWLYFQRPLLLVCSSECSAHVSAVCALASVLQEELGATVHTSLWAQTSQTHSKTGPGVADVGPLPWLYGQWEAVCNAQGKVFIIWSPEAKTKYEKWKEERKRENHRKAAVKGEEDFKQGGKKVGKGKKEKAQKDCVKVCNHADWSPEKERSTVIEPVFMAALACLDGTQQKCKGQGAAIVYFQGLGHRRDIPKSLRGVPRFCLPQDLRGLIQELGGVTRRTKSGIFRWHCWPRLLNKVLSIWLARRLAQRLQTLLPRTQEGTSSGKLTSDKTPKRLRLPKAAAPETEQEQEPLQPGSPWRTRDLTLQTFVALET